MSYAYRALCPVWTLTWSAHPCWALKSAPSCIQKTFLWDHGQQSLSILPWFYQPHSLRDYDPSIPRWCSVLIRGCPYGCLTPSLSQISLRMSLLPLKQPQCSGGDLQPSVPASCLSTATGLPECWIFSFPSDEQHSSGFLKPPSLKDSVQTF